MGEETCVVVPENDCGKVDPFSVLRESVSFGRYVSESLDWGKWSSFCQNRHLEEAEKFSTRGSVAQKKAYFEAHYKKIAAKKAAALLEQTTAAEAENGSCGYEQFDSEHKESSASTTVRGYGDCGHGHLAGLATESVFTKHKDDVVVNELKVETELLSEKDVASTVAAEVNGTGSFGVQSDTCSGGKEFILDTENVENDHQFGDEGTKSEKKSPEVLENVENQIKDVLIEVSRDDQLQKSPLKESCLSNQEVSIPLDMKRKSPAFRSLFLKKTQKTLQSSVELTTPIHRRKENTSTPSSKNSVKRSKDKQKLAPKALQINQLSYKKDEITHPVSKPSPTLEKVWNAKSTFSCFKTFQDVSHSHRTPTKPSASLLSKLAKASPRSEKRSKTPSEEVQPEIQKTDVKWQSLFFTSEKSSSSSGRKSNASQAVPSFCFWNGERAERRKENISKLEEKLNAQKLERQAKAKEEADNELKLLRQSLGFKARPMPDFYRKTDSPKTKLNKSPSTRSIFGRKRNSVEVPSMNSLPPLMSSSKSDRCI